jgi:hypothetical protein
MAFVHGKSTYFKVNSTDLSAFTNNVAPKRSADAHDTTTFGKSSKTYAGGLKDGTLTATGIYDDGATGPQAILEPLLGATVTYEYRPEGTGTGRPTKTGSAVLTAYEETAPVADMVTWSCTLQLSDSVTVADQA